MTRINIDATSSRLIDVNTASFWHQTPSAKLDIIDNYLEKVYLLLVLGIISRVFSMIIMDIFYLVKFHVSKPSS